jgi:hypothetical protein
VNGEWTEDENVWECINSVNARKRQFSERGNVRWERRLRRRENERRRRGETVS